MAKRAGGAVIVPETAPVAFVCSSKSELNTLVDEARRLSKGSEFILLLKNSKEVSGRILPAYINAYVRYAEHALRSESLQMELLLFIAGTFNIRKAIEDAGARGSSDFVAVCSSEALFRKYAKAAGAVKKSKRILTMDGKGFAPVVE